MSERSCVSEQGKSGLLWTVFEGEPFCSRRIASFADEQDARNYIFVTPQRIAALEAENERLWQELEEARADIKKGERLMLHAGTYERGVADALSKTAENLAGRITAAESALVEARAALEWYADRQNYILPENKIGPAMDYDFGQKARAALANTERARKRWEAMANALKDFAENGIRCDLNPTVEFGDAIAVYTVLRNMLNEADTRVRHKAKAALAELEVVK